MEKKQRTNHILVDLDLAIVEGYYWANYTLLKEMCMYCCYCYKEGGY